MAILKSARRSVRRHSAAIGLSDRSVRRILHKDLNFYPYKIAIVREFSDRDMANRRISSEQLLEMLNDDGVISTVLMTVEAHSHLSGYVNKQNYRYWAPENPQELISSLSTARDCMSAVGSHHLEFLVFTSLNEGAAVTVTSERNVGMLRNGFEPELRRRGIDPSSVWFQ